MTTEPDTEVATSGQANLNTITGVTRLVQHVLTTLQDASVTNVEGKQMGISECRESKIRNGENGVLSYASTVGRDPFSFRAPIDTAFLQTALTS